MIHELYLQQPKWDHRRAIGSKPESVQGSYDAVWGSHYGESSSSLDTNALPRLHRNVLINIGCIFGLSCCSFITHDRLHSACQSMLWWQILGMWHNSSRNKIRNKKSIWNWVTSVWWNIMHYLKLRYSIFSYLEKSLLIIIEQKTSYKTAWWVYWHYSTLNFSVGLKIAIMKSQNKGGMHSVLLS